VRISWGAQAPLDTTAVEVLDRARALTARGGSDDTLPQVTASETPSISLRDNARAFAVQRQGRWTAADVARLRRRLTRRGVDVAELDAAVEEGRQWFFQGPAHLFVCGGEPCRARARESDALFARLPSQASVRGLAVTVTACQGPCKQAPVGTLRVGERSAMFAQVHEACDWEAVLAYAGRAATAGTLLVDPGTAQAFVFDPVHDHDRASVALRPLAA
jgi:hypothetical protein